MNVILLKKYIVDLRGNYVFNAYCIPYNLIMSVNVLN